MLDGDPAPPKKGAHPSSRLATLCYMGTTLPYPKGRQSPQIFGSCLLRPNGWMDQDGTWHGGRPWSSPHCARWEHSSLSQKGGRAPNFRPMFIVAKRLDASRCHLVWRYRPYPMRLCVRWEPSPLPPKGAEPHPIFGPCLLWPNGWMDGEAAWYGSRPRPRPHCTRRGRSSCERGTAAPLFSAHVYCGHGCPSQLLLSSCYDHAIRPSLRRYVQFGSVMVCVTTLHL